MLKQIPPPILTQTNTTPYTNSNKYHPYTNSNTTPYTQINTTPYTNSNKYHPLY